MMKKIIVILITIMTIFIFTINATCADDTMTPEEFFNTYDYEYKYMLNYSDGGTSYISSPNPVTFSMSDYDYNGVKMNSGECFIIDYTRPFYYLRSNGKVLEYTGTGDYTLYIKVDYENNIGFDYVDIYRRSGDSFFLPKDLKQSPFLRTMKNLIPPMVGLIVSLIGFKKGWNFLRRQLMS